MINPSCTTALVLALLILPGPVHAKMSILYTKHNLSITGPGEIKALTEDRICVFCHTPHNGFPETPLWNKDLEPTTYTLYESSTMGAISSQPTGPTRLCLSCHDGTIALGDIRSSSTDIAMSSLNLTADRQSYLGTDISDDHPVSFSYYDSLPDEELAPSPPSDLLFYGNGGLHCSTCHDAHDDTYGNFLVADNSYSALCTRCHVKSGWSASSHQLAASFWNGLGTDPWPHTDWSTVAENGCENCHRPHSGGGPQRLLNYQAEEDNCYPCHNGNVAATDIQGQFLKGSRHRVAAATIGVTANAHDPAESPLMLSGHVECADCHNPHAVNDREAEAPDVSGRHALVTGIDQSGGAVDPAIYQYQICYKCHADSNEVPSYITRVIDENNTRLELDTANPSYHPVAGIGQNSDMPSIPSTLEPNLTSSSIIYCTDCHDSDESPAVGGTGPKGPHGSIYIPLLRERYETADNTFESYENYALCYRCHERQSILANESFQQKPFGTTASRGGHSGHLGAGAPCSVCHDPHGVREDGLALSDQSHLINFDALIVTPAAGQTVPFFTDNGSRAGSCTLVCHGLTHTPGYTGSDPGFVNSMYP